jgi:L-alanine-DL-glutamate epimerase-like enolase superfamily enzyme
VLNLGFRKVELFRRHPLTISRGTAATTHNLIVTVLLDGIEGIGEFAPSTGKNWTSDTAVEQLTRFSAHYRGSLDPFTVWQAMRDAKVNPPAMAAVDMALWDALGKQASLPLHRVLGLPRRTVPTSLTAGLNPPEITRERVPEILERTGAKFLKVKLGSPNGLDYDKAHFEAALEAAKPFKVGIRVDANGGWSVESTLHMMPWLSERDVDYLEQPLVEGSEDGLPLVFERRTIPIYIDESCMFSPDVVKNARCVDGINLKLMKCGGITEALRIVATARAHGLSTMIGCMSESSIAISAGAHLASLFDHVDLDSHFNLKNDPASGTSMEDGCVYPSERPGLGVELTC